jgi:hypothetical protein
MATQHKVDECSMARGGRGDQCRKRELEEQQARALVANVTSAKATTDRAAGLDAAIAATRTLLDSEPPVQAVNPLGEMLARFLHVSDAAEAATLQQAATAGIVELAIAIALAAFEFMGKMSAPSREIVSTTPTPEPDAATLPTEQEPTPSLATQEQLASFLLDQPALERVNMDTLYRRFERRCAVQVVLPMDVAQFGQVLRSWRDAGSIEVGRRGQKLYVKRLPLPVDVAVKLAS